jgi:hypothetical protein
MKNNAVATVIARRSVSIGDSTAKLGVRVLLEAGTTVSLPGVVNRYKPERW